MSTTLKALLKGVANAIRYKNGTTEEEEKIKPLDFPSKIKNIVATPPTDAGVYVMEERDVKLSSVTYAGASKVRVWGKSYGNQFSGSQPLTYIIFDEGIEEIGYHACYGAENLKTLILPKTLKALGNSAFQGTGLTEIALTDGTHALPDGITEIPPYCFLNVSTIAELALPDTIKTVGTKGFCTSQFPIPKLPANLETVGESGFGGNDNMTFTKIPKTVTSIGKNAFSGALGLTEITFEGTPTSIASTAFSNDTNLTVINCPWAEGAVASAPWGATNAVINYNYSEGDVV